MLWCNLCAWYTYDRIFGRVEGNHQGSTRALSLHDDNLAKKKNEVGGSQRLREYAWVCTRSSVYTLAVVVQLGVFVRLLTVKKGVSLTFLLDYGTLFLLLGCLVQP